ncbi:MAG: OmpA family protein [Bacteroides sp.]|nr:OmpA family protein [Roseburia sp.]MCM1346589.1 OmpA family protein [Bacteroides sp.]MCM1421397.1 OmpA family protein [Bacteroides sp.]
MRIFRTLVLATMTMVCGVSASAQCANSGCAEAEELGYKPYPYGFVQLQGGVGTTFTNVGMTDLISPTASVGVGAFFTPAVGARLHVNAWESKGGFKSIPDTYKFNYVNTNADLLLNLTNIISKKNNHLFNLILVGGIGLNYAWGNDDLDAILRAKMPAEDVTNAWGEGTTRSDLLSHNIRVGLLFDFNLAKHWNLGVEVDMNSLDDRFNSKFNNSDDWMLTAQLSLTYKFGHKKYSKPAPVPVEVAPVVRQPEEKPVETATVAKVEEPKTEVVVKDEPLEEAMYYAIRESDPNASAVVKKVIEWGKKYPNKKILVSGYADKGTGTPAINKKYAQQRADKVADALKKGGIPASQLEVKSYGDTVQPFAENDKNRCVIVVGK